MHNTRLIQILKTFSREEFREFGKFVASPFFSPGRNLIPLYTEIKKYYPAFDNKNLAKEKIFSRLYNKNYNDKLMRTLTSDMIRMCEEYLTQVSLRKYPFLKQSHLAYETIFRRLGFMSTKSIALAETALNEYGIDNHYFRFKTFVDVARVAHNLSNDKQILACDDIKAGADNIVYSFIASVSKSIHNLNANKHAFNIGYNDHTVTVFFKNFNLEGFLAEFNAKDREIMEIYFRAILTTLDEKDEKHYSEMKKLIYQNIRKFNHGEQYHLLSVLQSACAVKAGVINRDKYVKEHFDITNFILEMKLHKYSGDVNFPLIRFITFFNIGAQLKKVNWLEDYLSNYIKELSPEFREGVEKLCRAKISFINRDYDTALLKIIDADFPVIMLKYDVRNLMLKIYYEKNYIQEALFAVDSYKHFLTNNLSVSASHKQMHTEFLNYYQKLLKFKDTGFNEGAEAVRSEISRLAHVSEKEWLLEKAAEFIKKAD